MVLAGVTARARPKNHGRPRFARLGSQTMSLTEAQRRVAMALGRRITFETAVRGYEELAAERETEKIVDMTEGPDNFLIRAAIDILGRSGHLRKRICVDVEVWTRIGDDEKWDRVFVAYLEAFRSGHVRIWW